MNIKQTGVINFSPRQINASQEQAKTLTLIPQETIPQGEKNVNLVLKGDLITGYGLFTPQANGSGKIIRNNNSITIYSKVDEAYGKKLDFESTIVIHQNPPKNSYTDSPVTVSIFDKDKKAVQQFIAKIKINPETKRPYFEKNGTDFFEPERIYLYKDNNGNIIFSTENIEIPSGKTKIKNLFLKFRGKE